jgi:hypothetical protein
MADKKISALTASALPLAGTEVLPIVQSGSTVKVAVSDLTAGRAVSATQITLSTGNIIVGTTAKGVTTGSAIPLGFGVNNTVTAMTIDTASKVGVGTTAPTDLFTVSGGSIASVIAGSGAGLQMGRIAMYSSALGAGFTNYGGEIRSFSGAGIDVSDLRFYTANGTPTAERMRIASAGDITATTGNFVIGTAGKGIDFSANTHAAGMTSELLNWYEEGTWTATMIGSTAAPTTPVTATGYYTRIGNIVHVFASFANVDTTGATGDLQVTGLPFTSGASRAFGTAALDKFTLTGVQAFAVVYNGDTKVIFSENVNGGYGPNVAISSTTGVYAQFSITYQV